MKGMKPWVFRQTDWLVPSVGTSDGQHQAPHDIEKSRPQSQTHTGHLHPPLCLFQGKASLVPHPPARRDRRRQNFALPHLCKSKEKMRGKRKTSFLVCCAEPRAQSNPSSPPTPRHLPAKQQHPWGLGCASGAERGRGTWLSGALM